MSGSRKWRGALACVLWASVVACFLTAETTRNPPRSLKLRGLPRVDGGKTNSFWVAVQKAASRNKTDAQTYVERIIAHAKKHVNSSKVVDRDDAIQALVRSMKRQSCQEAPRQTTPNNAHSLDHVFQVRANLILKEKHNRNYLNISEGNHV